MNHMNMLIIAGLLIVIVILVLVIVLLMMNKGQGKKKTSKATRKKGSSYASFNVSLPQMFTPLPKAVEQIPSAELLGIGKKIFDAYKVFNYPKKSLPELEKKEWHSWQVSILLQIYKNKDELFIPVPQEKFHEFLLKASENDVKSMMTSVIKKYENYVKVNKTKDELCRDVRWTVKDVSVIFYFLTNYRNYSK